MTVSPKKYQDALRSHTEAVTAFLALIDAAMKGPSTPARGKRIAAYCNAMEMANDRVRYGLLGIDFRTDKKPARATATHEQSASREV